MAWKVQLYETSRGEQPVKDFITRLKPQTQAKAIHLIDLLEQYGQQLALPHAKRLERNLYELRIRGKQEARIFYCFDGQLIILLHGFRKQSQKIPRRELETGRMRRDELT